MKQIFFKNISLKHVVTEMSGRGNVLVGKCSVKEVSFGEVFGQGNVSRGSFLGEVSVEEMSNRGNIRIPKV